MSSINEIVVVNITRGTKIVSKAGFGIPLILGSNCSNFGTDLVRTYYDIDAVAEDFAVTTREYKMANVLFSQEVTPEYIKIGKVGVAVKKKVNIEVKSALDSTIYSVTINGTTYTYTSDASATAAEIVTGLVAAINAGAQPITLTNNGDDFDIEANVAGTDFSISIDMSGKLSLTTLDEFSTDPVVALQNIKEKDMDFYFVLSTSIAKDDILALAAYIETQVMLFATDSIDSDITFDGTTDVLSTLKGLKYDRTFLQYTSKADNFLSAAWVGGMAPKDPGSATWKFKQGVGVSVDIYSDTVKNRILNKNGNVYTTVGGMDIFENGTVVGGEWIDIMQGTDWITVNMQANVYTVLVNEDKVDYTTAGIASISSVMLATLKTAVSMGILTSDVTPEVTAPKITDIAASDKATRVLKNMKFTGKYAGAIQKVYINGTLTV